MAQGFFITGTDTGVGKTVVTAALLNWLRQQGRFPGVMKPFECGVDPECHSAANSDALFLMEVGDIQDAPELVCPVRFKTPASPLQAAEIENRSFSWQGILDTFQTLASWHKWILVEGAGGLLVPLSPGKTVADLAFDLKLPLIIVARYQLGTQNHTGLTIECARQRGLPIAGLIFNQTLPEPLSPVETSQPRLISDEWGVPVLGEIPWLDDISPAAFDSERCAHLQTSCDFPRLFDSQAGGTITDSRLQ